MRSYKFLDYTLLILTLFFYIYGPVLNKFGNWFDLIFIISCLIFIFNINKINHLNKSPYYFFYLLILFYSVLSIKILFYPGITFLNWSMNFIKPFRILFTLFSGYFISKFLYSKKFSFYDLLKIIFFVIILHSFIIIFQFFNLDFRDFIYSFTTTGEFRSTFEYEFRMGGLSGGSGGAVLSTVQSLGLIIVPFLFYFSSRKITYILIFIGSIIILLSIILTGRSGIYCTILFLPLSMYFVFGLTKTLKYTTVIFSISIFLFLFINNLLVNLEVKDFYNSFYRTFDSFISLTETGKYENETVSILKDYILFPDIETLLFGSNDALLNYDIDRNLDSDIGYVRNLFSFGIFGFIIYIIPFIQLLNYTIKRIKKSIPHRLLFILLIIMAFFHSKESFLYARMFWSIISLIIGYIFVEKIKYKKGNNLCVE